MRQLATNAAGPLECGLPHESTTLPNGFGLALAFVASIVQIWLVRRAGFRARTGYWAAGSLFGVSLAIGNEAAASLAGTYGFNNLRSWLGAFLFLWSLMVIAGAALLAIISLMTQRRKTSALVNTEKRQFLIASTAAACAAPAAVLGFGVITRKDFRINEVEIKLPALRNELHGLKLLQLSDIHMGAFYSAKDLARVVDASNSLRPDVAFVTGDLITTKNDPLDRCLKELSRLRAGSGIWGCMGNHEHYAKLEDRAAARGRELDIHFLRNEAIELQFGDSLLNLVGVDYLSRQPYLATVADLVRLDCFNLLLAHTPEVFPEAAERGFDLTVSGHTHGGQLNLQLMGANLNIAELHTPYTKGLYTLSASTIYVNSGLGTIGPPLRLGAPAEITVLTLCKA
jgi:uncharacterized protein